MSNLRHIKILVFCLLCNVNFAFSQIHLLDSVNYNYSFNINRNDTPLYVVMKGYDMVLSKETVVDSTVSDFQFSLDMNDKKSDVLFRGKANKNNNFILLKTICAVTYRNPSYRSLQLIPFIDDSSELIIRSFCPDFISNVIYPIYPHLKFAIDNQKEWVDSVDDININHYQFVGYESLNTKKMGMLRCMHIAAQRINISENSIKGTSDFYFNDQYGFVKVQHNSDGYQVTFNLDSLSSLDLDNQNIQLNNSFYINPPTNSTATTPTVTFDDLYVEKEKDRRIANNYLEENAIFKAGNKYTYSVKCLDKNNNPITFQIINDTSSSYNSESFRIIDASTKDATKQLVLTVDDTLSNLDNYSQTQVHYSLKSNQITKPIEYTGLIENHKNTWLHPPRTYFFKILELNPFPDARFPLTKGKIWNSGVKIGPEWGDERWASLKSSTVVKSRYEVIGEKRINTNLGKLNCYIIKASAESDAGNSSLIEYFNKKYGFIKLEYTNVDNSKIIFELINLSHNQ